LSNLLQKADTAPSKARRFNLFAYGFRPHFLAAGLAAFVLVPLWAMSFALGLPLGNDWPPTLWHAHEMLFGFVAAAIGGFMLTAVPSWTSQRGFAGRPLVVVSALWLLGRLLVATSSFWPSALVALVDVMFLPAIAFLIAPLLLREGNRNTPLLAVLAVLSLANVAFHILVARANAPLAGRMLLVAIDVVLLLITVIGGRIVPAFTAAALKNRGDLGTAANIKGLTPVAIAVMAAVIILDGGWPGSLAAGWIAATAAVVHAARLLQWRTLRTLRDPLVWVLHLAYLWLPIGFSLKAIALLNGAAFAAFWLHALTIGAAATMILGVMTRAALGHTGRPLVVSPLITAAYLLLSAAAFVRVFGLAVSGQSYPVLILLAAILWTAAFGLYLLVYTPILVGPRADGKPG
jgi:uncharacterized protein involved in response to NO